MLRPPYGLIVWASEALAVLVVVLVPVLVPVEVVELELEVAAAVAGREESFASVCHNEWMVSLFHVDRTWGLGNCSECKDSHSMSQDSKPK